MKQAISAILAFGALSFCLGASADSIIESWTCELEEDKSMDDVHAANRTWLKFVNDRVEGEVTSSVLTSVVGDSGEFLFADSFPDLATWAATKDALDSEEGEAMEESLEGIYDCSGNRLWKATPTE